MSNDTPRTVAEYREWWAGNTDEPYGLCWCGCAQETPRSNGTDSWHRRFKGEPTRFVPGHRSKLNSQKAMSDKRFNRWIVLEPAPSGRSGHWWCRCDCGVEKEVNGASLRKGLSMSCGCAKIGARSIDLTGQVFSRLTAISSFRDNGKIYWRCQCECGNTTNVLTAGLRNGGTKSCGCLARDFKKTSHRVHNLTGKRFGRLVAEHDEVRTRPNGKAVKYWVCICDCGKQTKVTTDALVRGLTRSCGCLRNSRLEGQRFGKLVVLERVGNSPSGHPRWNCTCDCAREKVVYATNLYTGKVTDCGCGFQERKAKAVTARTLPDQLALIRQVQWSYKNGAKARNYSWILSEEQFKALVFADCHYCGSPPSREHVNKQGASNKIMVNGIDRKDSDKGYEPDNVVPCCSACNYMKRATKYDDFVALCRKIVQRLGE